MKETFLDLIDIKATEADLQSLVAMSDKDELAQSLRLLAMYIALYKANYGELPTQSFENFLKDDIDAESAMIFENGLQEAITMLNMVLQTREPSDYEIAGITLN